ncbi:MAG TPA: sigma-70 family RNA polymerase sigma factor [Daejeonella sp.]|uniref:RNA polymerase sigma factor n=1 Tax=Daejeonella sp. TaxID=2805397 RepID=UPI002ED90100
MLDPKQQTDKELYDLLKLGDKDAYTIIYKKYWQSLFNSAYKRLKNKEQCQDILQVVLSDLWRRRDEVSIADLSAYLHTAVRFQVFKQISRKPALSPLLDEFEILLISPVHTDDALIETEILMLIRLWVEALPSKRRAIFLMYAEEELSTRQIAEKLGISQKTVQNQLNTALVNLRLKLSKVLFISLIISHYIK